MASTEVQRENRIWKLGLALIFTLGLAAAGESPRDSEYPRDASIRRP